MVNLFVILMKQTERALKRSIKIHAALFMLLTMGGCEYADLLTTPNDPYIADYSAPVGPGYISPPPYSSYGPNYSVGYGSVYRPPVYSRISVLSARWQSDRRGADVTLIVQDMLDRGVDTFRANNQTFGVDPDKGHHKRLHLRYRSRGEIRTMVVNEGETVRIR